MISGNDYFLEKAELAERGAKRIKDGVKEGNFHMILDGILQIQDAERPLTREGKKALHQLGKKEENFYCRNLDELRIYYGQGTMTDDEFDIVLTAAAHMFMNNQAIANKIAKPQEIRAEERAFSVSTHSVIVEVKL